MARRAAASATLPDGGRSRVAPRCFACASAAANNVYGVFVPACTTLPAGKHDRDWAHPGVAPRSGYLLVDGSSAEHMWPALPICQVADSERVHPFESANDILNRFARLAFLVRDAHTARLNGLYICVCRQPMFKDPVICGATKH